MNFISICSLAIYYWFLDVWSYFFTLMTAHRCKFKCWVYKCRYTRVTEHAPHTRLEETESLHFFLELNKPRKRKRMWLSWEHYDNLGTETRTHTHIHNNLLIFQLQIKFLTFLNQTKTLPSDYRFNLEQQQYTRWFGLIERNIPCFIYTYTHTCTTTVHTHTQTSAQTTGVWEQHCHLLAECRCVLTTG